MISTATSIPPNWPARYERGGASCLSVLTDEEFFSGSVADLVAAREATSLPVLRKDFTVDPRDVVDARLIGADAILLIAAVLDPFELVEMHQLASEIGLDVLVEVHDEPELEEALNAGATIVGVNQRDLATFEVDHERAAADGRRRSPTASSRSPSPESVVGTTPRAWPTPAITPCWWVRRS